MKITKEQLKQIIKEELNEVAPIGTPWSNKMAARGLGQPRWRPGNPEMEEEDPDPTGVFRDLYDAWQPETDEGIEYKKEMGDELGFEKMLAEDGAECGSSESHGDYLSNIYKWCPAGTKCPPERQKTKWWKGR